jgi:protein TonB
MPVDVTTEKFAEEFVEIEDEASQSEERESEENTEWQHEAAVIAAAAANAYVRKNCDYIQRRIKDSLEYPAAAKRTGVHGKAEVIFTIHENGTVSAVAVRLSSGSELLDKAAVNAIYAASPFKPPPSQARLVVPVVFSLR